MGPNEGLAVVAYPEVQVLNALLELSQLEALVQLLLSVFPARLDVFV
jgi:hypothetical protein